MMMTIGERHLSCKLNEEDNILCLMFVTNRFQVH